MNNDEGDFENAEGMVDVAYVEHDDDDDDEGDELDEPLDDCMNTLVRMNLAWSRKFWRGTMKL